jgi:hypothetical protein
MATENDKVNTGALATLVVVGTASMIGISLAVNALVRHELGTVGLAREGQGETAYRDLKTEQLERLSAPAALSDAGTGHVSIPIERATSLVLADLKRSPWNATPAPPPDAGADAAAEVADAGADAAPDASDAGVARESSDAGGPEPPGATPLSPSAPSSPQGGEPGPMPPGMRPSLSPRPPVAPAPTPTPPPAPKAPPAAPPPAPPAPPATP